MTTKKDSKNSDSDSDILSIIKDQHKMLKNCIRTLKDENAKDLEKQEALLEFIPARAKRCPPPYFFHKLDFCNSITRSPSPEAAEENRCSIPGGE